MHFRNRVTRISQLAVDLLETAAAGKRWVLASTAQDTIEGYTGDSHETGPGWLQVYVDLVNFNALGTQLASPLISGLRAFLSVYSIPAGTGQPATGADLVANRISLRDTYLRSDAARTEVELDSASQTATLRALSGVLLGSTSSVPIKAVTWGRLGLNTNASSQITFNHGLGASPAGIFLTPATPHQIRAQSWDATTITLQVNTPAGVAVGNAVSVTFTWLALL